MSVTHIASEHVVIGDQYLRQRCAWCGETLLEYDLARVAVPAGTDPMPATWPHGALVRIDGDYSTIRAETDDKVLPFDACARNPLTFASFGG